jgi:hypothetical protein
LDRPALAGVAEVLCWRRSSRFRPRPRAPERLRGEVVLGGLGSVYGVALAALIVATAEVLPS